MRKAKGHFRRGIAALLCAGMLLQSMPVYAAGSEPSEPDMESAADAKSEEKENGADFPEAEKPKENPEDNSEKNPEDNSALYEDGKIRIYNASQLNAIGTGRTVMSKDNVAEEFGQGEAVSADGTELTYSLDAQYELMGEIALEGEKMWNLPAGFTGSFTAGAEAGDPVLYNKETDTIYIYNSYQLDVICSEDAADEPVMSNDMNAEEFGMGQLVYPDGAPASGEEQAAQDYLTYSKEHNYVLATAFTAERPELKAEAVVYGAGEADGRAYAGQVIYHDEVGTEYILIGNEQQLRAIGKTDEDGNPYTVTEPVWAQKQEYHVIGVYWEDTGDPYLVYPGDADITEDQTLYGAPDADKDKYPGIGGDTGPLVPVLGSTRELHMGSKLTTDPSTGEQVCTYDETATEYNVNIERDDGETTEPVYGSWANYIIFRDIDFDTVDVGDGDDTWDPLMFSGNMEGRKGMAEGAQVTISNINVTPVTTQDSILGFPSGDPKLDTGSNIGIGFFGTITNPTNGSDVGLSGGTASVKNIKLSDISVKNDMTEVAETTTIVSGLTDVLGGLLGVVGGLLDGILGGLLGGILGGIFGDSDPVLGELDLSELLSGLFDIRGAAPDTFATGGFAGRIIGDVEVSGCDVEGLTISNAMDMTGGFVGNVEGLTEYEGLGKFLDGTVGALEGLLNIIPGLGLGDLITFLLDNPNLLKVKELLPTGYKQAKITDCSVSVTSVENAEGRKFAGGFAGVQTGAALTDCSVSGVRSVSAKKYAGGFAGLTRDAVIEGLLENLDIQIIDIAPSSQTVNCSVNGEKLEVVSATDYAGGFTGVVANSKLDGVSVRGLQKAEAKQDYAGGIAGRTTIGYGPSLADADDADQGLLGTVSGLLENVLTGEKGDSILNLVGVKPAELDGCTVAGSSAQIIAKNYAGGLFGEGDGTILTGTKESGVTGIKLIRSTENYAGGLAGRITTASAVGAIDSTLGVGKMLSFETNNVKIEGDVPDSAEESGFTVQAGNYAGGAFGQAIGGEAKNINISGLYKVTARNYAGGFAGSAGTGSLVDAGGLDILGLGAIKIDDLLSVGEAVVLKVNGSSVSGLTDVGCTVETTGTNEANAMDKFLAGGFVGECSSAEITDSSVKELRTVQSDGKDGYAGGFAASSFTGGLAEVTAKPEGGGLLEGLIDLDDLLGAAGYLIPKYTNCTVDYTDDPDDEVQVKAAVSGGFIAEMTGGVIDNSGLEPGTASVTDIQNIEGTYFAGGFAGYVVSGGLAESGGLSLLRGLISTGGLSDLLSVLEVYIPEIHTASVSAGDLGLVVKADSTAGDDTTMPADSGSAGGYLGYGSGVQITDSGLSGLRSTGVEAPEPLDAEDGSSYFGEGSAYAVTAPQFAGGYVGKLDIGNAAAVGGGLTLLGTTVQASDLLETLAITASKIDGCDVTGNVGGFSVLASGTKGSETVGMAGGYVGQMCGAQIEQSDVHNFAYIIGQKSAGGYVGTLEPGNVASIAGETDVLHGLVTINNNFLSLVQSFVPFIRNSSTDTVPCGGAVRAEDGSAGGYAGHSLGGQIEGSDEKAAAYRIRSVYGLDYAGGFTGLMETASVADTDSLKLLGDIIKIENPLTAAQGVYPVEKNTAVYGPLSHVGLDDWNDWVTHVGSNGPFGNTFTENDTFQSQDELDKFLEKYVYGYHVTSPGRATDGGARENGSAGGYVGKMLGGQITSGNAYDLQRVNAWRAAGGYAGEMIPGSLLSTGSVSLAGLDVLTGSLPVLQTFVPVIKSSDIKGYGSGYTVSAAGTSGGDTVYEVGYAGGYVGRMTGGQIWGAKDDQGLSADRCSAIGLRKVNGTAAVGGFAGLTEPGTTLTADTASENGLLNQILGKILNSSELLEVLPGMVATIKYADVSAWDDYGYVVNGSYSDGSDTTKYADSAGGFAGRSTGTVFGEQTLDADGKLVINEEAGLNAEGVRSVIGGKNAGGFLGKSSVAGVAEVADAEDGSSSSLLGQVLNLDGIEVLDIFRTYIYASHVTGSVDSGLEVTANEGAKIADTNDKLVYEGNAGGFAGSLLSGDTHACTVSGLRAVRGQNFTGGFTGYMGKTGLVDADGVDVLDKLLGLGVGVADVIGCQAEDCTVTGIEPSLKGNAGTGTIKDSTSGGFTVTSLNTSEEKAQIAGGFVGYADLGRMTNDKVYNLKQVSSGETAGGFVGKTSHAYLAEITVNGALLELLTDVLNVILKELLYADNLQEGGLIHINLGIIELDALYDGDLVSLTLLGLPITAALVDGENVLRITIGDSKIELGYDKETGEIDNTELDGLTVNLIKANRSKADGCLVSGIAAGYDVYGGGAGNEANGSGENGYAGGFAGYNDSGLLENNTMLYADVIRGAKDKTGPFSGQSSNESVYEPADGVDEVEQTGNTYRIYREADVSYTQIKSGADVKNSDYANESTDTHNWNVYTVSHMTDSGVKYFTELKDAVLHSTEAGKTDEPLNAYMEDGAKAVLMLDTPTETTGPSDTPEPPEQQDPCEDTIRLTVEKVWKDGEAQDRPQSVTLTVWQEKVGIEGSKQQYGDPITLTAEDALKDNDNIWRKILSDLPVYENGKNGEKIYYKYTVTETVPEGYKAEIIYSDDGYTVTITNSLPWHGILPDAGGMGTRMLYLAGAILAVMALWSYVRSRTRTAKAAAGSGTSRRRRQRIHDRHRKL